MRIIAGLWGTSVTSGFIVAAWLGGIPRSPTRSDWQIYAQVLVLILIAIGGTLVWRFRALGASMITAGAVALGALAAVEHSPGRALAIALAFYVPGLLFWLDWQRQRSLAAVGILAITMVALLTVGGFAANRIYDTHFGPVQPESPLEFQPVESVEWIWSGAVTTDSASVKARVTTVDAEVRLAVSSSPEMTSPSYLTAAVDSFTGEARVMAFDLVGLEHGTDYWYAIEADAVLDLSRQGHFRTFAEDAFSFSFSVGSCASTGSNGAVFDTIRELDPLFHVVTGDFFYANIAVNDPSLYVDAFTRTVGSPAQSALYRDAPVVYTWDDHDYGPNNGDFSSPSREAAQATYRSLVPHYPLSAGDGSGPIYQAFTVGRVRFIVTDTRSERSPSTAPDNEAKTMLGAEQKQWLKNQLSSANGIYPVIVWVNGPPWIGEASDGADSWAGYSTERREIADFIAGQRIEGLMMLSGDAHMLAVDNGSNSDYSSEGGAAFPIFHAAALDRHGSVKGGPYSEGAYPGGGQFGLVTINDTGSDTIEVIWSGRNWKNEEIVSYRFTVDVPATSTHGTRKH
jgi:phosphodiesterase/alkaline phosphatase D-like protein